MSDTEVRPKRGAQIGPEAPTLRQRSGEGAAGARGPEGRTRRAALSTIIQGGLAAMVASLARPSTTHAHQDEIRTLRFAPLAPEAEPVVPPMPSFFTATTPEHLAALEAEIQGYGTEAREKLETACELSSALTATLTTEQRRLFEEYGEALGDHFVAASMTEATELRRHFPGLAPALAVVQLHIAEGRRQCEVNPGYCCFPEAADRES